MKKGFSQFRINKNNYLFLRFFKTLKAMNAMYPKRKLANKILMIALVFSSFTWKN
jgi:hypothetical protein